MQQAYASKQREGFQRRPVRATNHWLERHEHFGLRMLVGPFRFR